MKPLDIYITVAIFIANIRKSHVILCLLTAFPPCHYGFAIIFGRIRQKNKVNKTMITATWNALSRRRFEWIFFSLL